MLSKLFFYFVEMLNSTKTMPNSAKDMLSVKETVIFLGRDIKMRNYILGGDTIGLSKEDEIYFIFIKII